MGGGFNSLKIESKLILFKNFQYVQVQKNELNIYLQFTQWQNFQLCLLTVLRRFYDAKEIFVFLQQYELII